MKLKLALLLLALCMGFSQQVFAGGRAPLIDPPRVELSADNTDAERVKNAIIKGGAAHTWTVIEEKPGQLTLQLVVRNKHTVVINADYDAKGYKLSYVSSVNMDEYPRHKKPYIHSSYVRWLAILTQSITLN